MRPDQGGKPTVSFGNFPKVPSVPSLKKAQTVRIDVNVRIVWSSVHWRPYRNFDSPDTIVIMPAVGAAMAKQKGWLRNDFAE